MPNDDAVLAEVEDSFATMVSLQEQKVLSLARRLKPGLTAEDVRNPHDFNDLDDPDFHYEDGMLAGLAQALAAVRAMRRERFHASRPAADPSKE